METGTEVQELNDKLLEKRRKLQATKKPAPKPIGQVICLQSVSVEHETDLCEKHGTPMREFGGNQFCSKCVEEDREADRKRLAEDERQAQKQRKQTDLEARFAAVQIGKRFQGKTWDDYRPPCKPAQDVKQACQKIAQEFSRHMELGTNWLMVGNCGTGKNMLSALIAQTVVRAGHTALHTTAAKLVRRIRSTWGGNGSEEEAIAQFVLPDLLVIDEVGVQAGSDTEQRLLTEVINDRYEAQSPTICLSNLTVKDLESYLGVRAMDRFYEGQSRVLVFTWGSWRRERSK